MAAHNGPTIRDVILRQYELTDAYHDQKAHSAWIASTVYFAFSIGFYSFWSACPKSTATSILATVICLTVFCGAMSFVSLQFRHRWDSVVRTGMYHWLFDNEWRNIGNELDYRALKLCFERQYERDLELGIAKRRKAADIPGLLT